MSAMPFPRNIHRDSLIAEFCPEEELRQHFTEPSVQLACEGFDKASKELCHEYGYSQTMLTQEEAEVLQLFLADFTEGFLKIILQNNPIEEMQENQTLAHSNQHPKLYLV